MKLYICAHVVFDMGDMTWETSMSSGIESTGINISLQQQLPAKLINSHDFVKWGREHNDLIGVDSERLLLRWVIFCVGSLGKLWGCSLAGKIAVLSFSQSTFVFVENAHFSDEFARPATRPASGWWSGRRISSGGLLHLP